MPKGTFWDYKRSPRSKVLGKSDFGLSPLQKRRCFIDEYQNEYRYLIVDELEERKNIRFEIGDLKDLATIMSKSEFLKTL